VDWAAAALTLNSPARIAAATRAIVISNIVEMACPEQASCRNDGSGTAIATLR
jgi:hypothetical protein